MLLVTEESAETTFMSPVIANRSNFHLVWPNKRDIQILNGDSILVFDGYFGPSKKALIEELWHDLIDELAVLLNREATKEEIRITGIKPSAAH